jgi:coenzyme F420-reducing hydrogenase beta subunit
MNDLRSTVLKHDLCIGCGVCTFVEPDRYEIKENTDGFIKALCNGDYSELESPFISAEMVCPFSDATFNEDEIAKRVFDTDIPTNPFIGRHLACYVGRVADEKIYQDSSSGGIGRWILSVLLRENLVDGVIAVFDRNANESGQNLFEYAISRDSEEVLKVSKSAYYPVEMSKVLAEVKEKPGRYAITGVPCFIKAVRNLCERDPVLKERIQFTVGIVCGHLKSRYYAELLGWQLGVEPPDLRSIDFRKKLPGKLANEKGVIATRISDPNEKITAKTVKEMFGTDYGLGLFKYRACDYCDDVVAETADISIGDAWLPEFMEAGNSLVIVRNRKIAEIIDQARIKGEVILEAITSATAKKSQNGGFRHRRLGLAYRLNKQKLIDSWTPKKRVDPQDLRNENHYKQIFDLREQIMPLSVKYFRNAKKSKNLNSFEKTIFKFTSAYQLAYSRGFTRYIRLIFYHIGLDHSKFAKFKNSICKKLMKQLK